MKKYLAIVIAIAVLLAPLYVVNAADARDSFAVQSGYVVGDTIAKVEAGVQITHYAGMWFFQGDAMARTAFADKIDPANFEMKVLFDKVPDRTKVGPFPWGGAGYDCWLNTTLMDADKTWAAAMRDSKDYLVDWSGICFMMRIYPDMGPDNNNSNNIQVEGYMWYDGAQSWDDVFGNGYDGNATTLDVDPQGQSFDLVFGRSTAGVWSLKVNDIEIPIRASFNQQIIDRVFYKGAWQYTPKFTYVGTATTADCNLVTYEVAAATEFKTAGAIYIPAVTAFAKYVGPELEFGTIAAVPAVSATGTYSTGLHHPAVTATSEVKEAGKTYVAAVAEQTEHWGPELTLVPQATYFAGVPADTSAYRVKMTKYVSVTGGVTSDVVVPKSQKVDAKWVADTKDGKMIVKDIYLKLALSSAVADPFILTVTSLNGKSLFKDATSPIIVCPANGGFYNDPTIDAYEQGEGKITEMWLANNWESANASQTENGTQITDEGKGWLKVKNGTEELSAISKFTVDHTAPVITGAAPASVVTGSVKITITDDNLSTFRAISPVKGNTITWPSNNTFTAKGAYKIVATDKAGNMSQLAFTIK